jgi:hypothetical protein
MVIGGIAVRSGRDTFIRNAVQEVFDRHTWPIEKEIKWSSFRRHQINMYEDLVDLFFELLYRQLIHYHILIFDTHKIDRKNYDNVSKDGVLNRMYYQIFLHRCLRFYGRKCNIWLYPDQSHSLIELPTFRNILNTEASHKFSYRDNPVQTLDLVDSKQNYILQLNDIITGSIGYIKNNRHSRDSAAKHKVKVADQVRRRFNVKNYDFNTPISERFFTVWNFESRDLPRTIPQRKSVTGRNQPAQKIERLEE